MQQKCTKSKRMKKSLKKEIDQASTNSDVDQVKDKMALIVL